MAKVERNEIAEGVTIYCGDALEILPTLVKHDHVFTDPPYEKSLHDARGKKRARPLRHDGHVTPGPLGFAAIDGVREKVIGPMVEACGGWLLIFCTPEGIAPWRDAIEAAGARYKRACFWHKPDSAPQFNGQGPAMAVEPFVAAWCGSGFSSWNGGGRRNLFTHETNAPDRHGVHPTEKPVSLFSELVTLFSAPGSAILDPFCGSGTTGVAAVKAGRGFTGIERDQRFFDITCERISRTIAQPDFFVPAPAPRAKQARLV